MRTVRTKRFRSWPASLGLFGLATVGEFAALAGWYWGQVTRRPLKGTVALWSGFAVERYAVVLWLDVPRRVITPAGNLHRREKVILALTGAEVAVWTAWLRIARREPAFAAVILGGGIHFIHSYEVALIKHRELPEALKDPGVVLLTALETVGGICALALARKGRRRSAQAVLFGALLAEHIFQVSALKREEEQDRQIAPAAPGSLTAGESSRPTTSVDGPIST